MHRWAVYFMLVEFDQVHPRRSTPLLSLVISQWKVQGSSSGMISLVRDLLLVALAAVYIFYAFGLGSTGLPSQLQKFEWVLRDYLILHQATSAMLLPYALFSVVFSKR